MEKVGKIFFFPLKLCMNGLFPLFFVCLFTGGGGKRVVNLDKLSEPGLSFFLGKTSTFFRRLFYRFWFLQKRRKICKVDDKEGGRKLRDYDEKKFQKRKKILLAERSWFGLGGKSKAQYR